MFVRIAPIVAALEVDPIIKQVGAQWCSRGKHYSLLAGFRMRSPNETGRGPAAWCYECEVDYKRDLRRRDPKKTKAQDRASYEKHGEKANATAKRKREEQPDHHFNKVLWSVYRKRLPWYTECLRIQGGVCAICGSLPDPSQKGARRLAVDHDHRCCPEPPSKTRRRSCGECTRSLLCYNCNMGNFRDDPVLMLKATVYVLWWRREHGRASDADLRLLKDLQDTLSGRGEDGQWLDKMYGSDRA